MIGSVRESVWMEETKRGPQNDLLKEAKNDININVDATTSIYYYNNLPGISF